MLERSKMISSTNVQHLDATQDNGRKRDTKGPGARLGNSNARKHGLNSARRVLNTFGLRALDGRSRLGVALRAFRNEIVKDLGGEAGLSAQRRAVLDVVIREKLLLDSIDAYVLSRPSLIVRQRKALLPVVKERQAIADSFIRNLQILGLDRIKPPAPTLADIFAKHAAEKAATASATEQPSAPSIAAQRPTSQPAPALSIPSTSVKVAPPAPVTRLDSEGDEEDPRGPLPEGWEEYTI
jgi:hypothetical protein